MNEAQSYSTGSDIVLSRGQVIKSRDIFVCYSCKGDAIDAYWVDSRNDDEYPKITQGSSPPQRTVSLKMSIVPRLRSSDVTYYFNITTDVMLLRTVEEGR